MAEELERWPGYNEQSWKERFHQLDREFTAETVRFYKAITEDMPAIAKKNRELGFREGVEASADFLLSESEERLKDGCPDDSEVMTECAFAIRALGQGEKDGA